jgi:hypothetical protein
MPIQDLKVVEEEQLPLKDLASLVKVTNERIEVSCNQIQDNVVYL